MFQGDEYKIKYKEGMAQPDPSDSEALFSFVYQKYKPLITKVVSSFDYDKDDISDITHDILIKIHHKIVSFKNTSTLVTWVYRVATNHCLDLNRKKSKYKFEGLTDFEDIFEYVESDQEDLQVRLGFLHTKLELMNPLDKQLLIFKYAYGYSIEEICEETDLKSSTVKMRLKRAKIKLRNQLSID